MDDEPKTGRPRKYHFDDLKIGDSKMFDVDSSKIRFAASSYSRSRGVRLSVKATSKGARVTRIA